MGGVSLPSYPVNVYSGDLMREDFLRETAVTLDRLLSMALLVKAVTLREDLWPGIVRGNALTVHGFPVVPLPAASPVMWGVIV